MAEQTFEQGYRDGWQSVSGEAPLTVRTCPPEDEWDGKEPFQLGFEYGRADALTKTAG